MSPFTSHTHLDMQMQYSFDYCQQVSLPYSSQQRGTFYFRTPCKVQVFGVCCEPLCRQVFFLIDEAQQAGKGAVVVVSLVHAFFHLHGLGERRVTLQADNCVGQNKNTTMMWYLAWRVITGQHEAIQLNFMLPGHTKFRPDSYFGLFKKYYRRQDHVDDMDDLADCVRQCGQNVTCVPQLYQDWHYYDWNAFLFQWFSHLAGLGRCYTFEFDCKHPGVMRMKTLPSDTNPTEVTMLRAGVAIKDIQEAYQSQVMPPVITPSRLSLTRSLYLYERVREYVCDPQKRDKVCPKPSPGTGPDSGNASSLPESDQPGPSNATPHSPTVEGQKTHTVKCKMEVMVVFLAGEKRRPRSELILAYQCTVCGNKYARPCPHTKRTQLTSSLLFQVMNTVVPLRRTIPVLTKEARVHPSAGVGKNLKLTGHFLVQCVASSTALVALSTLTRRPSSMVHCNEPDCEMHALYVV